jgi:hypothetical protein
LVVIPPTANISSIFRTRTIYIYNLHRNEGDMEKSGEELFIYTGKV